MTIEQAQAEFSLSDSGHLIIFSLLSGESAVLDFSAEHPVLSNHDIFLLNQVAFLAEEIQLRLINFLLLGVPQMTSDSLSQMLSFELANEEPLSSPESSLSIESYSDLMQRLIQSILVSCLKKLSEKQDVSFALLTKSLN